MRTPLLLRWSVAASLRGWYGLSTFLLDLDLFFAGLGRAHDRVEAEREKRRDLPAAHVAIEGPSL